MSFVAVAENLFVLVPGVALPFHVPGVALSFYVPGVALSFHVPGVALSFHAAFCIRFFSMFFT